MDKVINLYETLFVVNPTVGDDAVKATVAKFTDLIAGNGTIVKIDEWGKRRLAYPINDIPDGYYVLVYFKSAPDFVAELERLYRIDESIMRDIVVKSPANEATLTAQKAPAPEPVAEPVEEVAAEPDVEETVAEAPVAEEAVAPADAE